MPADTIVGTSAASDDACYICKRADSPAFCTVAARTRVWSPDDHLIVQHSDAQAQSHVCMHCCKDIVAKAVLEKRDKEAHSDYDRVWRKTRGGGGSDF